MLTFAFYKAHTPWRWRDALIRWATGSIYSHVEFVLESPNDNGQAVCISASKRDGNCVRIKPFRMNPDHWDFVTVEGDYAKGRRFAVSQVGQPYNVIGAVLSIAPISLNIGRGRFCSHFMGMIGVAAGLDIPKPHTLNPQEFYEIIEGARCK